MIMIAEDLQILVNDWRREAQATHDAGQPGSR